MLNKKNILLIASLIFFTQGLSASYNFYNNAPAHRQEDSFQTVFSGACIGLATGTLAHVTDEGFFPYNWGVLFLVRKLMTRLLAEEKNGYKMNIATLDKAAHYSDWAIWLALAMRNTKRLWSDYRYLPRYQIN